MNLTLRVRSFHDLPFPVATNDLPCTLHGYPISEDPTLPRGVIRFVEDRPAMSALVWLQENSAHRSPAPIV